MAKISRRRRLSKRKSGRRPKAKSAVEVCTDNISNDATDCHHEEISESQDSSLGFASLMDHDYGLQNDNQCQTDAAKSATTSEAHPNHEAQCVEQLIHQVKSKLDLFLPQTWMSINNKKNLHVVKLSLKKNSSIQRSLVFQPSGSVELFVHGQEVNSHLHTAKLDPPLPLSEDTVNSFVDRAAVIMNSVNQMAICGGYDDQHFQDVWSVCPFGEVDKNIFEECRYVETFRAVSCSMLVPWRKWRCGECQKLYGPLQRRKEAAAAEERHPNTGNVFLTEEQRLKKLKDLRTEADNLKKQNNRLQERIQEVIEKEGVTIENSLSNALTEIMSNTAISPAQSIFLQQQIKASQQKNSCGMRWHPTMIRFALALHLTSPAAYELVRQTGMVKLPCSMTLFDYSHVQPAEEGVDRVVLESVAERVKKFPEKHKKYHVLMMDEMYISQNLVFEKSSGKLIGYTKLDTIESEIKNLEELMDATETVKPEESLASKVLVYMIKGVSNGIKEVVALFAVKNLSANQLKDWTWHLIGDLEKHGIFIIAVVCDGSSVNRYFFKKHKPATQHESGIIFDTWNRAARDRKLFFIAGVPHLLKTIRNCLLNSRWDGKKSRRKMKKNGKKITWDFIIKLYEEKKNKTLRKSFKLNAQNVYPDSYARMRVGLAGQVLSNTVARDLESQGWSEATETINFIDRVNSWFDCLNGAHTSQGRKKRNENLNPYTSKEDQRFNLLDEFLKYLDEWQLEPEAANQTLNSTIAADNSVAADSPDCDVSEIENAAFDPDADTPAAKKIMSRETLEGIKITTLAFKPLIHFLLDEGVSFINARIFCQDPLEQHFSKVRAGQGGSTNPNLKQVINKNRALHTIGQLGIRKRKGNSAQVDQI